MFAFEGHPRPEAFDATLKFQAKSRASTRFASNTIIVFNVIVASSRVAFNMILVTKREPCSLSPAQELVPASANSSTVH